MKNRTIALTLLITFISQTVALDDGPGPVSYDLCYVHEENVATAAPGQCDFSPYYEYNVDEHHADGRSKHIPDDPECFRTQRVRD